MPFEEFLRRMKRSKGVPTSSCATLTGRSLETGQCLSRPPSSPPFLSPHWLSQVWLFYSLAALLFRALWSSPATLNRSGRNLSELCFSQQISSICNRRVLALGKCCLVCGNVHKERTDGEAPSCGPVTVVRLRQDN